tara:strand:+ start:1155 stop:3650 length:2496 start_codon:yes stop_codon:yes gene_type:complete
MMSKPSLVNMDEVRGNLQHPDAEIRLRAVKDLISTQDPGLIPDLNQLARKETDVQVRYEIRKSIGTLKRIQQMRNQPKFQDFTSNLVKVEKALKSQSEESINKAFRYIMHYRLKQFLPMMEEVVKKSNSAYQKNLLIRFMLSLGGELYFNKITAYLSDKDPRVISTAIEALENIGNTKALGYIAQLVTHNHNRVKATAMKALYNLGDQSALKLLQKMADSPHTAYRNSAVYALKEMRLPQSLPLLKKLSQDQDGSVSKKALEGIQALADNGFSEALNFVKNKSDQTPNAGPLRDLNQDQKLDWIRDQLDLISEGKIVSDNVSKCFVAAIKNEENDRIKASLLSALGRIGNESHVQVITPFLNAKNDRVRANAVEALGYLLPRGQRSVLLNCFEDHNNRVVGNAIMALSQDSPKESRKAMQELCKGSNLNEQLTAVYCIGALAEDEYLTYSDYLLESSYSEVREKMLKVLEDLSQDLSNALRLLKQWNLRIAAFDNSETDETVPLHNDAPSCDSEVFNSKQAQEIDEPQEHENKGISEFSRTSVDDQEESFVVTTKRSNNEILSLSVFDKASLILVSGAIGFALVLNLSSIVISDRYEFYKLFLDPFRFLLINEWFHAFFFIVGFPATLMYFLYINREVLLARRLFIGLVTGIFLHQYVQLLDTVRLDIGPLVNFLAYHSSKFYMEQHSGNSRWAMQIFNLPWLFLPILIESSLRYRGLQRIVQGLLTSILILITIWLAQLNLNASVRIDGAQKENLLFHLEYRRDQLTALLKQNRLDSLSYLAGYNKAVNQQRKIEFATKLNTLKFETKRNRAQLDYLLDRIRKLESMIDQ